MENMKLDTLPVEILMNVFNHLPTFRNISMVNKLFHTIVCDSHFRLCIDSQFEEKFLDNNLTSSQRLQSIQNSKRKISKVQILGREKPFERRIIGVVEKFSATIKVLELKTVTVDDVTLREILSLIPNVEHIVLYWLRSSTKGHSSEGRRFNDDLNLNKLKSLSIESCEDIYVELFNHLPAGVLTKLEMYVFNWRALPVLLSRQRNIKEMKMGMVLGPDPVNAAVFNELNLESLELNLFNIEKDTLTKILSKQRTLKSLTLFGGFGSTFNEQIMSAIAELSQLEILEIISILFRDESVLEPIRKLTNLRELKLECNGISTRTAQMLAGSNNISLKKLIMSCSLLSANVIASLAKSVPNLTHFELSLDFALGKEADQIMRHFKFVEFLKIVIREDLSGGDGDYYNPKLRELEISDDSNNSIFDSWLPKLTASYPNLQKLKLTSRSPDSSFKLRSILNGFPNLESLTIRGESPMIEDDLDYVCDHNGNLKFVSWGYIEDNKLIERLVEKLRYGHQTISGEDGTIFNVILRK